VAIRAFLYYTDPRELDHSSRIDGIRCGICYDPAPAAAAGLKELP